MIQKEQGTWNFSIVYRIFLITTKLKKDPKGELKHETHKKVSPCAFCSPEETNGMPSTLENVASMVEWVLLFSFVFMMYKEDGYHENSSNTAWHMYHLEGSVGLFYFTVVGTLSSIVYSTVLGGLGFKQQDQTSPFHGLNNDPVS